MAFPDSFLDELVARTDITELVGGYVRLTKRSGSNMFGLCPFHSEKTPSFSVSAEKQIYHCFGCGKGGGAINFLMEIENLPFPEAVEVLAKRAGMAVPDSGGDSESGALRRRVLDLNRAAARWFHGTLSLPVGKPGREYLERRGITPQTAKAFGLGYAPDSWDMLMTAMTEKGYSKDDLLAAGLIRRSQKGDGAYDLFRNRLVFPVIDISGNVIGFSGRILSDGEPKYLNTPETVAYNKSRSLFAINLAKKSKSGMIILAEGNIDVVALHQAGFDSAVATLGTSLTAEQVRLLSRYTENVVIAYDSDAAGQKAASRAISLLEKTGMSVKVLQMGDAKDPDEFIKARGADAFANLLRQSENHIEYRLSALKREHDLSSDEGRLRFLSAATALLAELNSAPEREIYAHRAAEMAGVSKEAVELEIQNAIKRGAARRKKRFETEVARPSRAIQPADKEIRYKNEYSAAAEEGVIRCLVQDPALLKTAHELDFQAEEFTSPFLARVFETLARRFESGRDLSLAAISAELPPGEASHLSVITGKPESLPMGEKAVRDYIEKIRTEKYKKLDPSDGDMLLRYREMLMESKKYREKGVGGY